MTTINEMKYLGRWIDDYTVPSMDDVYDMYVAMQEAPNEFFISLSELLVLASERMDEPIGDISTEILERDFIKDHEMSNL
jgi:hypothetical protein